MKTFLSLGAGVQSSTLALMCAHGEIPMPDAAIFADTGWEPKSVYDWLNWLEPKLPFPVYRVSAGSIVDALIYPTKPEHEYLIPWHTDGGMGKRQCTNKYKIEPLRQKMRELIGPHTASNKCAVYIGISLDEAHRMKPAQNQWQLHKWPLIDRRMSRGDCLAWMLRHGYPTPPKSSCIGCPFKSDQQWRETKKDAEAWDSAVRIDAIIRSNGKRQWMHRSCVPIDEAEFNNDRQPDMFGNECEGMCGV